MKHFGILARRWVGVIAVVMTVSGCSGLDLLDVLTASDGYKLEPDVAYGALPRQRLDIYRPVDGVDPARPTVVFLYGGGWTDGERGKYRFVGQSLAKAGYVTVVADYRLYPQASFPSFLEDSAAAVAWVDKNVPGASGRIVVAGHSAGAYNAAMLACDKRYLDAAGPGRKTLAGFIGMAGPYDFVPTDTTAQILASPDDRSIMPIKTVDGGEPPTLLLVAEGDDTVHTGNSDRLAARMKELGDSVEIRRYTGLDHGRLVAALGTALSYLAPVRADAIGFLGTRSNPSAHAEAAVK
jgi:acetyl esterase/lipase